MLTDTIAPAKVFTVTDRSGVVATYQIDPEDSGHEDDPAGEVIERLSEAPSGEVRFVWDADGTLLWVIVPRGDAYPEVAYA